MTCEGFVRKRPVTKMGRKKEEMEVMPLPQGPVKSRSCTDILCLLLFLVCIVGWAGVSYVGFKVKFSTLQLQRLWLFCCFRMEIPSCWCTRPIARDKFVVKVTILGGHSSSFKILLSVYRCPPLLMAAQHPRYEKPLYSLQVPVKVLFSTRCA